MLMWGRVWCVDDDINTDLILPIHVLRVPPPERPQHMFMANRPGWAALVRPGDILVAGKNYGMGSSRPAAQVMKDLGLACLLAESVNGLFFRNALNYAFPTWRSLMSAPLSWRETRRRSTSRLERLPTCEPDGFCLVPLGLSLA
jgi:3-isopropylmalate dehydratase small subunit